MSIHAINDYEKTVPEYDSWEDAVTETDNTKVNEADDDIKWKTVFTKSRKTKNEVVDEVVDEVVLELPDEEYPELGSKPRPKDVQSLSRTKKGGGWSKMDIVPVQVDRLADNQRTKAFEKLGDKQELSRGLFKTRMCRSATTGEACPHGESCRFAHTRSELVLASCFFGARCQFVKQGRNGNWYNSGVKRCNHTHPDESRDNFMTRTGTLTCHEVTVEPKMVEPKFIPLSQVLAPTSIPETVLKVPQCMAAQAIELALKSGTNVRVEVI